MADIEGEQAKVYSLFPLIRDFLPMVRPYRTQFWGATFFVLLSKLVWLYPPLAFAQIVTFFTKYVPGQSLAPIGWIFVFWGILSVVHYAGQELGYYWGYQTSERMALDAMSKTVQHVLLLDLKWHERENTGNKIKRITKGAEGIDRLVRMWFDTIIASAVNLVGMTVVIAQFDGFIALLLFLFFVTYFAMAVPLTRRAGEASNATNRGEEDIGGLLHEVIGNIRSVKVLGMGRGLLTILHQKFGDLFCKIQLRIWRFRFRGAVLNLWSQLFRLGLIGVVLMGIMRGQYEVGFLVLFYNYYGYVWDSIDKLSDLSLEYVVAKYGFLRMKQLLDAEVGIDRNEGKQTFPKRWKNVSVSHLSFAYGKKEVLHDLSFSIRRGERIGVVGVSGAGKSTLFKLLLKEHENYQGEILLDQMPLKSVKKSSFFRAAAVVLQDTEVFNFSLRDNIAMANPTRAHDAKLMRKALAVSRVTDFLDRLPMGLETVIGEKGIRLSGGEKQRLGIARAVFKDPELLFLDEATSHLDLESEEKIRDSLHHFFQSVTAIVIAHRLTTIREMDRIIVLENGRIIEEGTFAKLIARKGRFEKMWKRQSL